MKSMLLTCDKVALVDEEDYEQLSRHNWYARKEGRTWYAVRHGFQNGKPVIIRMHREILRTPIGMETDHKDHNGLNNQRYNLRVATHAQNLHNQKAQIGKSSQYKGVCWHRLAARWQAQISVDNKHLYLGLFLSEVEAALAYDRAARKYFGEFAHTNF